MIRHSTFAIFVFSFHSLSPCFLIASLMVLVRADFNGLWLYGRFVGGCIVAFFASASARSFPSISACPGIHIILMPRYGYLSLMSSTQWRKSLMIVCPDCRRGLFIAFMAD